MNQNDNCSNEISLINQESKINGKIDNSEVALSYVGEGAGVTGGQTPSVNKDDNSFSLPNLSIFPKRFDDNQETHDDIRNAPDLPNGHNNPDAVDIEPRTKSLDELLQESEDLPDSELLGSTKEFVETKADFQTPGNAEEGQNSTNEKNLTIFDDNLEEEAKKEVENNTNVTTNANKSLEDDIEECGSDSLDKAEKLENPNVKEVSKENDGLFAKAEEAEDSKKSTTNENEKKAEEYSKAEIENIKESQIEDSFKLEISESQFFPVTNSEEKNVEQCLDSKEEAVKDKIDDEGDDDSNSDNKIDGTNPADDNGSEIIEDDKSPKIPLEENESLNAEEPSEECHCTLKCHERMKILKECLSNACTQLDGYIKLKKQEELNNFLQLLNEIELIAENKKNDVSEDLLSDAFQEDAQGNKKRKSRASKVVKPVVSTPKKEVPEKKIRIRVTKPEEPISEINFKNLKGLAVFAKWPNSGWYYPGIIEGITNSDWKEATNVTVKFYDGLVRDMKNINILPAHLIPPSSVVCDLDDETEMVVLSTNRVDNNCVEFTLSTKEGTGKNLEVNFIKLAIKALHMKTIKQQLESNMDVMPKKMHMVSLDNLVSGRRSRIRTHKDDDDMTESVTPRKNARKSPTPDPEKSELADEKSVATPVKSTPNKRSLTVGRSTPKRTATPNKRMKQ